MLGTIINCMAIIIGSLVGLIIGRFYTEDMKEITIKGIGLITIIIALQSALQTIPLTATDYIIVIFSIVIGGTTGVILQIESKIESLGKWIQQKASRESENHRFIEGFVTASIIFETGPLAILGSIYDGLNGDLTLLLTKSALDGFVSIAFAATMGIGVMFSIIVVFIYQAPMTIFAAFIAPYIPEYTQNIMSVVGGVIILGLGFKLLDIKDVKVANLIPAIFWVIPLSLLAPYINIIFS